MNKKKGLSKRTVYTIFLIKFVFSIVLIAWTITMTFGERVGSDDDDTFMSTYHVVDANYNSMVANNDKFHKKYEANLLINGKDIGALTYKDIYLSQRVIKNRKIGKNILKLNKNEIVLIVKDKHTNQIIKDINATIVFTMPSTHKFDTKIQLSSSNMKKTITIGKKSYWNIMGSIKVGNDEGHFFIKTNAH